jgi:glutathione peroxidase
MKLTTLVACGIALALLAITLRANEGEAVPPVLNFTMKDIDGKPVELSRFQGKVVLFVNVASQCGYTPQYEGLQSLFEKYQKDGLVIIGIPANDFGRQEPGSNAEIKEFCRSKYGVTFPMLSKVVVKGDGICPLYKHLTSKETNPRFDGPISWNFEKFLISRKGEVVGRFLTKVKPNAPQLVQAIESELKKN